MHTFGVIGAGHLASYTIAAMRNGGFASDIFLSPRGTDTAKAIASKHDCKVLNSNQAVADNANVLLLAVRPGDWEQALGSIELKPQHTLVSAVSGVSIAQLQGLCGTNDVVRIMPSSFIEFGHPFIPAFPANQRIIEMFGDGCSIIALNSEKQLDESMIMSCAYAWQFGLMQHMQDWFVQRGWDVPTARDMVMRHWQGSVDAASGRPQAGFDTLLNDIATPGTYTRLGFDELEQQGGLVALMAALEKVDDQLAKQS